MDNQQRIETTPFILDLSTMVNVVEGVGNAPVSLRWWITLPLINAIGTQITEVYGYPISKMLPGSDSDWAVWLGESEGGVIWVMMKHNGDIVYYDRADVKPERPQSDITINKPFIPRRTPPNIFRME